MTSNLIFTFRSRHFSISLGEEEETNPGIYGKALAHWLAENLKAQGLQSEQPFAEDFGWCIRVYQAPHSLYIACANIEESTDRWQITAWLEGGFWGRMWGNDQRQKKLTELIQIIRSCLTDADIIENIQEETTSS